VVELVVGAVGRMAGQDQPVRPAPARDGEGVVAGGVAVRVGELPLWRGELRVVQEQVHAGGERQGVVEQPRARRGGAVVGQVGR